MSKVSLMLLFSMLIEYIGVELFFKVMALKLLIVDAKPILSSIYFSMSFIGPVFFGPVSGYITDHINNLNKWKIPFLLSIILGFSWISINYGFENLSIILSIIISVTGYLSSNIRIAISKHLILEDDYSKYHTGVVWILEIVPLIIPLIASIVIISEKNCGLFWTFSINLLLLIGVMFLKKVLKKDKFFFSKNKVTTLSYQSFKNKVNLVLNRIIETKELKVSIYSASVINFLTIGFGYLAIRRILKFNPEIGTISIWILVIMGIGGIIGGLFQSWIKKYSHSNIRLLNIYLGIGSLFSIALILIKSFLGFLILGFFIGILGSCVSILVWNIRLKNSKNEDIGIMAGLTSSFYKIVPLTMMPILGILEEKELFINSVFLILGFLICPLLIKLLVICCKGFSKIRIH